MFVETPIYIEQLMDYIDPQKTVNSVRKSCIPPLICLACRLSDEEGKCTSLVADVGNVKTRWEQESESPTMVLIKICDSFIFEETSETVNE